ncbi:hypothetical protein AB0G06_14415 [Nonomuraea dietziae]|uniref:hypothetical protein n=1 Tax=Nonomuraea dietziae TaxID=65515 RepID=UPI0033CCC1EE
MPPVAGGHTLWARLPNGNAVTFAQVALRHGVAIYPGPISAARGGADDRIRMHFLLHPDQLTEAARRLAAAWHTYR